MYFYIFFLSAIFTSSLLKSEIIEDRIAYSTEHACANKKIIICAVVKNAEKGFEVFKKGVTKLVKNFLDYQVIVYENNSIDLTKQLYKHWSNENPKVHFISEDLTNQQIKELIIPKGDYRIPLIARARNIVLKKSLESIYDDFDFVLMVDADNFLDWDIEAIIDTVENKDYEWDMVGANGSYDIYALRSKDFSICMELIGFQNWARLLPIIGREFAKILSSKTWYKVDSAFGGMAIYRRNSLKNCSYDGLIGVNYINYLTSKDFSQDVIYKYLSDDIIKTLRSNYVKLLIWNRHKFKLKFLPENPYICEHISLHLQMKNNGADNLYVNPNWRYTSSEHTNYFKL